MWGKGAFLYSMVEGGRPPVVCTSKVYCNLGDLGMLPLENVFDSEHPEINSGVEREHRHRT